jgi:ribosomal protein L40E
MAICRHCNAEVSDGATFCPVCGKPVMKKEKVVLCPECGLENPVGTAFCVHCGSKLPGEKNPNLESESVQKLKGLLPVIKGIASTFDDPYAGASQEEIEKMTYVCPVCGKRNRNNEEKCARCGRDRKRTAALAAKKRVPSFKDAVEIPDKKYRPEPKIEEVVPAPVEEIPAAVEEPIAAPVEETPVAKEALVAPSEEAPVEIKEEAPVEEAPVEEAPVEEEKEEAPAEEDLFADVEKAVEETKEEPKKEEVKEEAPQMPPYGCYPPYGYPQNPAMAGQAMPYGYGQLAPIIQPLVIVPYVSQDQPLWQIATPEEIAAATLEDIDNQGK